MGSIKSGLAPADGVGARVETDHPAGSSVLICGQLRVTRRWIDVDGFYTVRAVYGVTRWHWSEVRLANV